MGRSFWGCRSGNCQFGYSRLFGGGEETYDLDDAFSVALEAQRKGGLESRVLLLQNNERLVRPLRVAVLRRCEANLQRILCPQSKRI